MNVFSNNGVRIGVITIILFLAVPLMFPDRSASNYEASDPASIAGSPVGISRNPFSKFYNRVGAFYGFKKRMPKNALGGLNAIDKEYARLNPRANGSSVAENGEGGPSSGGIPSDIVAKVSSTASSKPGKVDEYVQIGDKIYDVVTDPAGKKYVLTDKGPIDFDAIMAKTLPAEDAENLKKYAKGDRTKDVMLSYSKYANQGYFDNEGGFVFTGPTDTSGNRYGTFSGKDNPSLFGLGGGLDSGAFPPNIWGDEAFDESKTKLSAKYNNTRTRAAAIEKARSTVSYNQAIAQVYSKDGVTPVNLGRPAIEKLTPGKGEGSSGKDFSSFQSADSKKQDDNKKDSPCKGKNNCVILDTKQSASNVADTIAGNTMTKNLLCANKTGCSFEGSVNNTIVSDPWVYPKDIEVNPWKTFRDENESVLLKTDMYSDIVEKGRASDIKFTEVKALVQSNDLLPKANIIMINGTDTKTGQPLFLGLKDNEGRDYYPAQIVQGLFGQKGKIITNPAEIVAVADLPNTIYIAPSKIAKNVIESADKTKTRTVVEFEQYSIDPNTLNSLYDGIADGVTQIPAKIQAKQALAAKEEAKKAAELAKGVNKQTGAVGKKS